MNKSKIVLTTLPSANIGTKLCAANSVRTYGI